MHSRSGAGLGPVIRILGIVAVLLFVAYVATYAALVAVGGTVDVSLRVCAGRFPDGAVITGVRFVQMPCFMLEPDVRNRTLSADRTEPPLEVVADLLVIYYPLYLLDRWRLAPDTVWYAS